MDTTVTRHVVLSIVFGFMLASSVQAQDAGVLNTNGSFESAEPGVISDLQEGLEGWVLSIGSSVTEAPVFEIVEEPTQHGSRALKVTVNGLGSNAWDIEATADAIPVVPGTTYTYSVWARSETGGGTASFTVGNYNFSEYGRIGAEQVTLTEEWQEFTFSFTITDEETLIRAPIHFSYSANAGNAVYIDNLRIIDPEVAEATKVPVIVEAESGELGSEFDTATEGDPELTYITITTDYNATTGTADYPGDNRTASYEVTFPGGGWYDLFVRIYVGPDQFDDDSFFYADSFGVQDPANGDDWTTANGLATAGFTEPDAFLVGPGSASSEVWKWVNLSKNTYQGEAPDSFYVDPDNLTQTFQIGAREDGLRIDKLAFGRSDLYFTVENLDLGTAGVEDLPDVDPPTGPPLADGIEGKFLGNVYSPSQLEYFELYWNQVTPENAGKWGSVEGTRDNMNWSALDAAYALAKDNGLPFRFHVLVWGNQQPGWIAELPPDEQLEEIEEWFTAVAERYPDIDYLEVVNEPLHDPPDDPEDGGYIEALGGTGETGWDWVITAFQMARDIFPESTKLMINEYNILSSTSNAQTYLELIELLQDEGLIDGIGVQGHAFSTRGPAFSMRSILDLLAETGLPIQVTEMDVDGNPTANPLISEAQSDQTQLESMQRIFPALWTHPAVEGITMWGWRPGMWRTEQEAYLVRANGEERPALEWLRDYLTAYASPAEPGAEVPHAARLLGNHPNPFGPSTQIRYVVSEPSDVTLTVFDVLGRQVRTLVSAHQAPGEYAVPFEADGLASGVYLYRLEAGSHVEVRRMTLLD